MPPVAAQPVEKKPHFVKAPDKGTLVIVRQHTGRLRGTDPLVVVPRFRGTTVHPLRIGYVSATYPRITV